MAVRNCSADHKTAESVTVHSSESVAGYKSAAGSVSDHTPDSSVTEHLSEYNLPEPAVACNPYRSVTADSYK